MSSADCSGSARAPAPPSGSAPDAARPPGDWPRALVHKMAWLLAVKLLALGALWWWFFSPAHRPPAHGGAVAARLFSGAPAPPAGVRPP